VRPPEVTAAGSGSPPCRALSRWAVRS